MSGEGIAPQAVPAGWYPDPADPAGKRWWDGTKWTTDVQPAPQAPSPQPFAETPVLTRGSIAPDPFEASHSFARATRHTGISHTRAGWWISFQPLWGLVTQVVLVVVAVSFLAIPQALLSIILLGFNLVVLAILVALAHADRNGLRAGGNETAASPWWILLTPLVYLILRAREINRYDVGGWAGLVWWIVAAVLSPGVAILAYFGLIGIVAQ